MCSMLLLITYAKCGNIVIGMNVFDMIPLTKTTFPGLLHEAMNIFFRPRGPMNEIEGPKRVHESCQKEVEHAPNCRREPLSISVRSPPITLFEGPSWPNTESCIISRDQCFLWLSNMGLVIPHVV
ncbi:unnamed protein product [Brassica oleracea var. botrytis]